MIQELFGGAGILGGGGVGGGDRRFPFHGSVLEGLPSSSPASGLSATNNTNNNTTTNNPSHPQPPPPPPLENLRCPRCDSPNTKFCYYNNYNLTQPRHFCKTCRRYWTKGGALRNVPIGGGCRKGKTNIGVGTSGKSTSGKAKIASSDFIKSNSGNGFDIEQSTNPILWGSPQNSQLLALLRSSSTPNPNPNSSSMSNFVNFKDRGGRMIGSHVSSESVPMTEALNARTVGFDLLGQVPIESYPPLFRNYRSQQLQNHQQQQQQSDGMQELYQRLKSSINYQTDQTFPTSSNNTSMPIESSLNPEGEFGGWNPVLLWSDLSATTTTNGAFS
ncbi:hypothetical protein ACHQM5_023415 [Ranunculus cassubicifolius]